MNKYSYNMNICKKYRILEKSLTVKLLVLISTLNTPEYTAFFKLL